MTLQLKTDIINEIRKFSEPRKWKFGLRQKYLYKNLYRKGYKKIDIQVALKELENDEIIYMIWKYNNPDWFISKKYRKVKLFDFK
jgi:hypothetical protein